LLGKISVHGAMWATILWQIITLEVLLLLSALFSGTETALFSLSKLQLRRLRDKHPAQSRLIQDMLAEPHQLLSTILLGNTVVNVAAAALGYVLIDHFAPRYSEVIAVPTMLVIILIFCEIMPKTFAIRHPEFFAVRLARPAAWFLRGTKTLREWAERSSAWCMKRILRRKFFHPKPRIAHATEEEYLTLLTVSAREGILRKEEKEMIRKILALADLTVKEIMTPRVDMMTIEDNISGDEIVAALKKYKHRRVPVIHDTPDTVVGILRVKEFLASPKRELREALEPPLFVPEAMSVAVLMRLFRKRKHPIAIVVDEYGGTSGLVTLEDVLEEIVGEIEDEFDVREWMIQSLGDGRYLVNGKTRLEQVNEQLGLHLEAEDVDTIAGWFAARSGSIPREGDKVSTGNASFTARKVIRNRLSEVEVEVKSP
jgi:putative hemolysin